MRIVGGAWRSRVLKAPAGSLTRPTTDRVREALFSSLASKLGADLAEASVLDAFAGSGALGLEALSRGAATATFVERDRTATRVLRENISAMAAEARSHVLSGDVFALAKRGLPGAPFSLILLDPPYTLDPADVARMLGDIASCRAIAAEAVLAWEHSASTPLCWPAAFRVLSEKHYGTTAIDFAVYEGGSNE